MNRKSTVNATRQTRSTSTARRSTPTVSMSSSVETTDLVVTGVERLLNKRNAWTGSMQELDASLRKVIRRTNLPNWPKNPRGLRAQVDRVVTKLRARGIKTRFGRMNDHNRKRYVEFVR